MNRARLRQVARRHGLESAILFGSRARGDAGPGSDCDVCVVSPGRAVDDLALISDLCRALGEDVDLCVFERAGPSLMYTVAMEGRLLVGSRGAFDRLRLRAIREWQDCGRLLAWTARYLDREGA